MPTPAQDGSLIAVSDLFFQTFDKEKYKHLSLPEPHNNNEVRRKEREALLLPGLRIDERGGIYLNPLLDSNNAYFK